MHVQTSQEVTGLAVQIIPCLADSMARSVSLSLPGPSLVHLTSELNFPLWDPEEAIEAHERFYFRALENPKIRVLRTKADLAPDGKIHVLLGMRYVPDRMTLLHMEKLKNRGLRVLSLAYDYRTQYGDGCRGTGELTDKGEDLLRWMAECGIMLDLSHTGYVTANNALSFILQNNLPVAVMASHSGCFTESRSCQDLTDVLLRRVAHMKGYVGISYTHPTEFLIHVRRAFRIMLGRGNIGISSACGKFDHFQIIDALVRTNLDPHIFGENFKSFLARALP